MGCSNSCQIEVCYDHHGDSTPNIGEISCKVVGRNRQGLLQDTLSQAIMLASVYDTHVLHRLSIRPLDLSNLLIYQLSDL